MSINPFDPTAKRSPIGTQLPVTKVFSRETFVLENEGNLSFRPDVELGAWLGVVNKTGKKIKVQVIMSYEGNP